MKSVRLFSRCGLVFDGDDAVGARVDWSWGQSVTHARGSPADVLAQLDTTRIVVALDPSVVQTFRFFVRETELQKRTADELSHRHVLRKLRVESLDQFVIRCATGDPEGGRVEIEGCCVSQRAVDACLRRCEASGAEDVLVVVARRRVGSTDEPYALAESLAKEEDVFVVGADSYYRSAALRSDLMQQAAIASAAVVVCVLVVLGCWGVEKRLLAATQTEYDVYASDSREVVALLGRNAELRAQVESAEAVGGFRTRVSTALADLARARPENIRFIEVGAGRDQVEVTFWAAGLSEQEEFVSALRGRFSRVVVGTVQAAKNVRAYRNHPGVPDGGYVAGVAVSGFKRRAE